MTDPHDDELDEDDGYDPFEIEELRGDRDHSYLDGLVAVCKAEMDSWESLGEFHKTAFKFKKNERVSNES